MKLDKEGRLFAKLLAAFNWGAAFMTFTITAAPDMASTLGARCDITGSIIMVLAVFFAGLGWFTEEKD